MKTKSPFRYGSAFAAFLALVMLCLTSCVPSLDPVVPDSSTQIPTDAFTNVSISLSGLMTFVDGESDETCPTVLKLPPAQVSWMGDIFSGTLEETVSGKDIDYQVHGTISSDRVWLESLSFSSTGSLDDKNRTESFRIDLKNVPLVQGRDENAYEQLACARAGSDVQRYIAGISYQAGLSGETQYQQTPGTASYMSADWSSADCPAALEVVLSTRPIGQTPAVTAAAAPAMGSGGSTGMSATAMKSGILTSQKIVIGLGLLALLSLLAMFLSSRSFESIFNRMDIGDLEKSKIHRRIKRYHALYLWVFIEVLVMHAAEGFCDRLPLNTDPNWGIKWTIMIAGAIAAGATITLVASSTVAGNIYTFITAKNPFENKVFKSFNDLEGYFWGFALVLIVAHLILAGVNTSVWLR